MNPTHRALREATGQAHDRVDAAFAGFDLTDRDSYARFLQAHAALVWLLEAQLPGERIVPDWPARKRGALLREDIALLGYAPRGADAPPASSPPAEDARALNDPEIAGILYVLEGSRLGGRFLARGLPQGFPRAYLDADQRAGAWQELLAHLDELLQDREALGSAIDAALETFAAFEASATHWLEKD